MQDDINVGAESLPVENAAPEAQQEKMVPQSQVSNAIRLERERAYEKGRREALEAAKSEAKESFTSQGMSPEDVRRMVNEEAVRHMREQQQQAQTQQVVGAFVNKIEAAAEKHPELKSKLASVDFDSFAPIVALATDLDNTADIMAHLVNNTKDMGNLLSLIDKQPQLAAQAVYEISNSLKQNESAARLNNQAKEPFDLIQRSGNSGLGDEESLSTADFRKMFR